MATSPSIALAVQNRVRWVGSAVTTTEGGQLEEAIDFACGEYSMYFPIRRTILLDGTGSNHVAIPYALAAAIRRFAEGHGCILELETTVGNVPGTLLESPRDWRLYPYKSSSPTHIEFLQYTPASGTGNIRITYWGSHLPVITTPSGLAAAYTGTPGATTFAYKIASEDDYGVTIPSTTAVSVTLCAATLDSTHYNVLTWTANPDAVVGTRIYRSSGGTTGYLATVAAGVATYTDNASTVVSSATIPTANTAETTVPKLHRKYIVLKASAWLNRCIASSHAENTNQDGADGVNWEGMKDAREESADKWDKEADDFITQRVADGGPAPAPKMFFRQLSRRDGTNRPTTNPLYRQAKRVR